MPMIMWMSCDSYQSLMNMCSDHMINMWYLVTIMWTFPQSCESIILMTMYFILVIILCHPILTYDHVTNTCCDHVIYTCCHVINTASIHISCHMFQHTSGVVHYPDNRPTGRLYRTTSLRSDRYSLIKFHLSKYWCIVNVVRLIANL